MYKITFSGVYFGVCLKQFSQRLSTVNYFSYDLKSGIHYFLLKTLVNEVHYPGLVGIQL